MHEVLVNRLGGLSLPRKSVVRLTDRPDMTLDVYRGRKTTIQQQQQQQQRTTPVSKFFFIVPKVFEPLKFYCTFSANLECLLYFMVSIPPCQQDSEMLKMIYNVIT